MADDWDDWKEGRRMRAYELQQQGWKQQRIAEALGVSKMAVSQWMQAARANGAAGLQARPRTGAPRRLTDEQLHLLPDFLTHGAEAYGFRGEVWTCARVGRVIAREFDVRYDKSQVSRLLKRLNWTPQKPIKRASQRDEIAIARWRTEVWIDLKKRLDWNAESLFSSMNPGSTCCRVVSAVTPHVVRHRSCACHTRATICRS
jgi:transposase